MTGITRYRSGGPFEAKVGYCRAVRAGDTVYVAGTVASEPVPDGIVAQCDSALARIDMALRDAGSGLTDVVRATYYVTDIAQFELCWPALRRAFGDNPPAATVIEAKLIDPTDLIEIEVTAYSPR
ncbi:RidA family protein [Jannaschia sp. LMIT008]|uniref:RidA family protein n=1 Tax=Jannaschia maritima TaxID=3032585 RepID=UPI002810BC01|nr:RidA family protein [Jannaschia sp. LMIT008]